MHDDEIDDPLDPTGLEFSYPPHTRHGNRRFSVFGFRDQEHAENWKAAYYERAMGYGPIISVIEKDGKFEINVNESTSCD